jgi:hypothetical protein
MSKNHIQNDDEEVTGYGKMDKIFYLTFGMIIGACIFVSLVTIKDIQNANAPSDSPCRLPTPYEVTAFCQSKGFQGGWLSSSSCEGVQCYKELGDGLTKYGCFKEMDDGRKD